MYRVFFACQKGKHCHALVASTYPTLSEPRPTSLGVIRPSVNPTSLPSPHAFWSIPIHRMFFACQKEKHWHALVASTYPMLSEPRPTRLGVIQPGNVRSDTSPLSTCLFEASPCTACFLHAKKKSIAMPL